MINKRQVLPNTCLFYFLPLKVGETMRRKHIKMTRKHRRHFKNSARKTRIANTMPTIKRGGYRA